MRTLGTLAVVYLAIGIAIVALQAWTGTACDPSLTGTVPRATADYPPGLLGAVAWPASLYDAVVQGGMPVGEYLSPTECVSRPS
jgi:hypothetical protein